VADRNPFGPIFLFIAAHVNEGLLVKQFLLCLFLTIALSSCASSRANLAPSGPLRVEVGVSTSNEYLKEWGGVTYSEDRMSIPRLNQTFRGQSLVISFMVSGFGWDREGKTDLVGEFILLDSAGSVLLENKAANAHQQVLLDTDLANYLIMEPYTSLSFDTSDADGLYTIRGVVYDRISGKRGAGESKIALKLVEDLLN